MTYRTRTLNFSRSINVPTSRIRRVMNIIWKNGPMTKLEIVTRLIDGKRDMDTVSRGWGSTLFSEGRKHDYLRIDENGLWTLSGRSIVKI